ncbi:N-acetylmuramoyl-L-alanine amidase [Geobacillus thermodenitrificans]|uniref:N-acetylmuramoyl-L-alanine amidase n=1 Tax=Geobacillus thermodenitrificans TaxID=33940 RepID=UPI000C05C9F8|nr:N-acetylmuramoyl-L-alanine amidase [Geobacillus thermodenitrificans]ATO37803.1 N-acetylmuramoyl-L-alanine amidase [Geobacillus thermodenitrificans]
MTKKIFISFCLIWLAVWPMPMSHPQAAPYFHDVGTTHRAKNEIYYLAEGGIVLGSVSGYFYPSKHVTRAEAAAIIGRTLNFDGKQRDTRFKDVGKGNFASGYIQEAAERNIISGYKDGTFRPNQLVTRGEMALLINRAYSLGGTTRSTAVQQLKIKGIAEGKADGTFGEDEPIIRADFAVFVARAINPQYRVNGGELTPIGQAVVNASSLNVRRGPSMSYSAVSLLYKGQSVDILHIVGNWAYIRASDLEGFVSRSYLSAKGASQPDAGDALSNYVKTQTIIIDPGHGGNDPGATANGLVEKNINLNVALKVKSLFEGTGFNIALTREKDVFIPLSERVSFAKEKGGNVFVSIHTNAGGGTGTETYYYSAAATNPYVEQSKKLAQCIQKRLVAAWDAVDRGTKRGNLHVLRENSMPAALVELGFIDRKEDAQKLGSSYWQEQAAKAIYLGILDYYASETGLNFQPLYDRVQ